MQVNFFFADTTITLKDRIKLKQFIINLFKREKTKLNSMNYIFCSDAYLLNINQQFLQHDDYTDIITFDLSATESVEGEIYISTDRVKENSVIHSNPIYKELHRVIFHGALHLCGYKDKSESDVIEMRGAESKYLKLYFK